MHIVFFVPSSLAPRRLTMPPLVALHFAAIGLLNHGPVRTTMRAPAVRLQIPAERIQELALPDLEELPLQTN